MPKAERNGVNIDYEMVGSGPMIVFINAMGRKKAAGLFSGTHYLKYLLSSFTIIEVAVKATVRTVDTISRRSSKS